MSEFNPTFAEIMSELEYYVHSLQTRLRNSVAIDVKDDPKSEILTITMKVSKNAMRAARFDLLQAAANKMVHQLAIEAAIEAKE